MPLANAALAHGAGAIKEFGGFGVVARFFKNRRRVDQQVDGFGVAFVTRSLLPIERAQKQWSGFRISTFTRIENRQRVHCGQRLGMIASENTFAVFEPTNQKWLRFSKPALAAVNGREVEDRDLRVEMVLAQHSLTGFQDSLKQGFSLRISNLIEIKEAELDERFERLGVVSSIKSFAAFISHQQKRLALGIPEKSLVDCAWFEDGTDALDLRSVYLVALPLLKTPLESLVESGLLRGRSLRLRWARRSRLNGRSINWLAADGGTAKHARASDQDSAANWSSNVHEVVCAFGLANATRWRWQPSAPVSFGTKRLTHTDITGSRHEASPDTR